jgi:transposase
MEGVIFQYRGGDTEEKSRGLECALPTRVRRGCSWRCAPASLIWRTRCRAEHEENGREGATRSHTLRKFARTMYERPSSYRCAQKHGRAGERLARYKVGYGEHQRGCQGPLGRKNDHPL